MPKNVSITADIPPDLVDSDEALTRYGRWACDRDSRSRRCGSAERHFDRSTDARESLEAYIERRAQVPRGPGMTPAEAMLVQRALARVPDLQRTVLAILYIPRRLPPEAQLRILRIPPELSADRHLRGLRMFDNMRRVMMMQKSDRPALERT
jgi:hypothetical protein